MVESFAVLILFCGRTDEMLKKKTAKKAIGRRYPQWLKSTAVTYETERNLKRIVIERELLNNHPKKVSCKLHETAKRAIDRWNFSTTKLKLSAAKWNEIAIRKLLHNEVKCWILLQENVKLQAIRWNCSTAKPISTATARNGEAKTIGRYQQPVPYKWAGWNLHLTICAGAEKTSV